MAKLANEITLNYSGRMNTAEVAKILRQMEAFKLIKANKQGGTINRQKITKYKELLNK